MDIRPLASRLNPDAPWNTLKVSPIYISDNCSERFEQVGKLEFTHKNTLFHTDTHFIGSFICGQVIFACKRKKFSIKSMTYSNYFICCQIEKSQIIKYLSKTLKVVHEPYTCVWLITQGKKISRFSDVGLITSRWKTVFHDENTGEGSDEYLPCFLVTEKSGRQALYLIDETGFTDAGYTELAAKNMRRPIDAAEPGREVLAGC